MGSEFARDSDRDDRASLLDAHLDTVGVAGMTAPHTPRVENGRVYGRGAYDMKGALTAILLAAAGVRGLRGDVIVTAVADEELASIGTAERLRSFFERRPRCGRCAVAVAVRLGDGPEFCPGEAPLETAEVRAPVLSLWLSSGLTDSSGRSSRVVMCGLGVSKTARLVAVGVYLSS